MLVSSTMIIDITDASLSRLAEGKLVLLFTSPWCSGCKKVEPFMESLSESHNGIVFGTMDISKSPRTPADLGVLSLPTVIAFRNGREFERISGEPTKHELERLVKDLA